MNKLDLKKLEEKLDLALAKETSESLANWLKEKRNKHNNMAQQSSVEWLVENAEDFFGHLLAPSIIEKANEIHKKECISFAEQWETRCNEKNMDSKEQLYDEIYNK